MKRLLMVMIVMGGCAEQPPTAPTAMLHEVKMMTSRVNPKDFDIDELNGLTLDHNPFEEGVSMCRTMQREYCSPDGKECWWETDYYTVMRPDVCPIEPIP